MAQGTRVPTAAARRAVSSPQDVSWKANLSVIAFS